MLRIDIHFGYFCADLSTFAAIIPGVKAEQCSVSSLTELSWDVLPDLDWPS